MSQCQVPYRQHRIDPVVGGVATAVGGVAAAAEVVAVEAVEAAGEVVGYDGAAAGAVVAVAPEQGMTQTWDWE
jgi:hypothetical protein